MVELYTLWVNSSDLSRSFTFPPGVTSTVVGDLRPNTQYRVSLQVFNGAHTVTSEEAVCTTTDGEPEGVFPPEVLTLNSTAVQVLWAAPLVSNGAVTEYAVYLDGQRQVTGSNVPGAFELGGLLPFTVYDVQVEVCTVYACVKSNSTQVTTVEDLPADIAAPHVQVISSRSVRVEWASPGQPNGIMLGYDLRRRSLQSCERARAGQGAGTEALCSYLECPVQESVCGSSCYQPEHQVCCDGVVFSRKPFHRCCQDRYVPVLNTSHEVCCGGQLLSPLPDHQCCGGYYIPVLPGEVCCPNPEQIRVSVGLGDSCCGGNPFSLSGGQICCGGELHDGFHSQCCGGQVLDGDMICCGDEERGTAYTPISGMSCCGSDYVNASGVVCCRGRDGAARAHPVGNDAASVRCCGTDLILQEEGCCNGVGYNPLKHVCADRPSPGLHTQEECRPSTLCPLSAAAGAYCGTCHFNSTLSICTWDIVYTGAANRYTFTDADLEPHTVYEYRVGAWNSFGRGFSPLSRVTTKEDAPWGVGAPNWRRVGDRDDIIQLDWQPPTKPNGEISRYVVLRDGQERYTGTESSFTDAGGIRPFQEYEYQLRACTSAGCSNSAKVVAVTVQGVPENVPSPVVSALGPRALHLSWGPPAKPNGIVREYHVNQSGAGVIFTDSTGAMRYTVTGLQPHTEYSFLLIACTSAGCGASQPSTGRTLQDAPAGVWARPRHVVLNSSAVELYWTEPLEPNGLVSQYQLLRDGTLVFSGDSENLNHTDTGLKPNSRYVYELVASTGGGSRRSDRYVIQTPASSPERIPPPHNVNITGPRSVFVAWTPPEVFNSSLPLEYNVLLNAGSDQALIRAAGRDQFLLLDGLDPFTWYQIRVQACQQGGCGVGQWVYARTSEAAPEDQGPPTVTAVGPTVIEVNWSPPRKPNGLITAYFIHRRPAGTREELLVFIWSEGPLEFIDASDALQPFSEYEYRVRALNARGSTNGPWASTLTMEAEPEGMAAPTATPTSAYSVLLDWTQPSLPNGIISQYRVVYQRHQSDPTLNASSITALTLPGSSQEAHVFGLEPYTTYSLRVEAANGAGSVSSPWRTVRTLEASPSGLANFTVEKRESGRALLLHWPEPAKPNGVIKMYNIYSEDNLEFSGLSRQFLFRRLEPYTVYTLVLEACTKAGCTRTAPQPVTTDEAPPSSQPTPVARWVGANGVELSWERPAQPNGRISQYQVIGWSQEAGQLEGEEEEDSWQVLFRENNTQRDSFSHNITGLRPWTRYKFRVRVVNTAGHTDSAWTTVQTRQAPPKRLAPPTVTHVEGNPHELLVSWRPPEEANGVLLSYRLQRDDSSFHFSFDSSVLSYTDEDLAANTRYSYAVIACTAAGCITSPPMEIRTLEAPPTAVVPPTVTSISSHHINTSWTASPVENGDITRYALQVNGEEVYSGRGLHTLVSGLQPHTHYQLVLVACTNGGCTASSPTAAQTKEAPPSSMLPPTLKVTGSGSVEITWTEPEFPNGVIRGYELRRDGIPIYSGTDTRFHDFTLLPSVEYGYTVTANNSQGSTTSPLTKARTNPSAPSGVIPPKLMPSSPADVLVMWDPPARPNGEILNYTIYRRDPTEPDVRSFTYPSQHTSFHARSVFLSGLKAYHRYEVRVEACTLLGCAASDWATVQTLEAPPAGQAAPLMELQTDEHGIQTVFLLSWSAPSQPNGQILHYELYRRQAAEEESPRGATLVYRNASTSWHDTKLLPFTFYEYQVWAVNSAGRSGSPWTRGRTGPAPPEGVQPPTFLQVHATSAVVDISPPSKPNGIVSLYRVFANSKDSHMLLSEGTSRQQTLHGLRPFTLYSVGVEACTCYLCCSRGPLSELLTQASAPSQQPPARSRSLTSRSALVDWEEPLSPNGIIESCELHIRTSCPQPVQPVPVVCTPGQSETRFFGKGRSFNITGLQPYTSYNLRVACYNNMGSTSSEWTSFTTLKEPPQYRAPFLVLSNLTTVSLDWSQSFFLNGLLREFVLTESGLQLYSGFHSSLHIPRTSDKTFAFQVTCITDTGSVSSPVIKYHASTGIGTVEPTAGGKTGLQDSHSRFYTELWFIILMAVLGLLMLALLLGLLLQRALSKPPFVRERPPLVPLQKRSTMSMYAPSDSYLKPSSENCSNQNSAAVPAAEPPSELFDTVPNSTDSSSNVTLKAFTMHLEGLTDTKISSGRSGVGNHSSRGMPVLRVPHQTQLGHAYSQNSLHRSVSQLIDTHDKKSLTEDGAWDPGAQGHDSGMFAEDEEFADAIKGFSTVRKEHTMFTDTHL
ncbi:hypothetical protein MATL_G00155810 [Megalops atlanticus]|uniref:Fibronectin type-III domain-containing protein n=1 Tax=Megalops atlanticus TaxID=7932 RepID=A0A9D3T154_MEGAT|nr:hypothetical protein MATL_G00155810 [Megalops atlanticus]